MAGEPTACVPYDGALNANGYGVLPAPVHGSRLAHRAALAEKLGRPVAGVARHTCDNPPCVNSGHLVEGTQADNLRDMTERGRRASGPQKDQCVRGHDLDRAVPYIKPTGHKHRRCIECRREDNAAQAARRKAARAARKVA